MGYETFTVTALDDESLKMGLHCPGVTDRMGKCTNKCTHIVRNGKGSPMALALCKDCVVEYVHNLLEGGYWKLDSAMLNCHYS